MKRLTKFLLLALAGLPALLALGEARALSLEPPGLVARYCFNTGLNRDCSANGNNGMIEGDVTRVEGHRGDGARFGGYRSLGYIRVPNSPSLRLSNDFTIAYWAKLNSFAGIDGFQNYLPYGIQMPLAKSHDRSGAFTQLAASEEFPSAGANTATLNVGAFFVDNGSIVSKILAHQLGDWTHVAYTYKKSRQTLELHINGRMVATSKLSRAELANFSSDDLFLGAQAPLFGRNVFQYPFEGVLDGVRLYKRMLNHREILDLLVIGD